MHRIKCSIPPSTPAVHFVSKQQAATAHGQQRLPAAVSYDLPCRTGAGRGLARSSASCCCIIDNPEPSDYYVYKFILIPSDCYCDYITCQVVLALALISCSKPRQGLHPGMGLMSLVNETGLVFPGRALAQTHPGIQVRAIA